MPVSFAPGIVHHGPRISADAASPAAPRHGDMRANAIIGAWYNWWSLESAGEQRGVALARIRQCAASRSDILDLAGLGLRELPPCWPPSLKSIDLAHNQLTAWPAGLPAGLLRISLAGNRLCSLPDDLGLRLHCLDVADNFLTALPEGLPRTLLALDIARNRLTHLPAVLPEDMSYLGLSDNCLAALPETLPGLLTELDVLRNRLVCLPALLPPFLTVLHARGNGLSALPENLPPLLQLLDVGANRLRDYPAAAMQLGTHCLLHLDGNCFSAEVCDRILNTAGALDALGPIVSGVAMHQAMRDEAWRDIIACWYCDAHDEESGAPHYWNAVAREHGASDFFGFLERLSPALEAGGPEFKSFVGEWLTVLLDKCDLRRITFAIAHESTSSCEDRISLTLSHMQQARVAHDVENGLYDTRIPALIDSARNMFRQERLEQVAREKIVERRSALKLRGFTARYKTIDEVCVFLAYQVKLRQPLQLQTPVSEMSFFNMADLGPADLAAAEATVKMRENADFPLWLTRWAPWACVLQRLSPPYGAIQRTLENYMDVSLQQEVVARLEKAGLSLDDADAVATVGKHLAEEAGDAARWAMTRALLTVCGGANLLAPAWPPCDPTVAPADCLPGDAMAAAVMRRTPRFVMTRPRSYLHRPTAHLSGRTGP